MSNFDQKYQQVGVQINDENVTFNIAYSAPAPRSGLLWYVPSSRNPNFTGREDVLQQLHTALTSSKSAALTQAISGMGGIGKTQTAIEYLYRHHEEYQAIFWVRASSRQEVLDHYAQIARLLKLPEKDERDLESIALAVIQWLQGNTTWLLIIDNADDLAMVKPYLPTHASGHILLTTRAQAVRGIARKVELSTFSPQESLLFLLRRVGLLEQEDTSLDHVDENMGTSAQAIAHELGFLPLALDQAGAYIEENEINFTDYLTLYRQERKALLARRGGIEEDHIPVATTWSLAFTQLETRSPAALDLMRICAFLAPDAIAEEMFLDASFTLSGALQEATSTRLQWNRIIEELGKYSFLHRQAETKTLSIHRLVQVVIADEMDETIRHAWIEAALRVLEHVFPYNEVAPWELSQRYIGHALIILEHAEQLQEVIEEANSLRFNVAAYFSNRGRYFLSQALLEQVLRSYETLLGEEHPDTLRARYNLARLYHQQGKWLAAEVLYMVVLRSYETLLGKEHPDTLRTRYNLAITNIDQGKYVSAQYLLGQVLHSYMTLLGEEHPDTLRTRHALASIYTAQGLYERAQALLEHVLHIREKVLGSEHPDTLRTRNALSNLKNQKNQEE